MILADKIMELRKRSGWSQEELAGQLGVSRQAVSKWESAASVPDLDKILKLSRLFEVSTDVLLKDDLTLDDWTMEDLPGGETPAAGEEETLPVRKIGLEEANAYLDTVKAQVGRLAAGVALCILSPVVLILMSGLSDQEGGYLLPENLAAGIGMVVLLLLVAAGVGLILIYTRQVEAYEAWEKEPVELTYGVTGLVEKAKAQYESQHTRLLILGVVLCILSVVPLMVAGAVAEDGMAPVVGVALLLCMVAAGVYLLVRTCTRFESFQLLLEEGDYLRRKKLEDRRNDAVSTLYWCAVTAAYLAWSFLSGDWHFTWILWPVAGAAWGVVAAVLALRRKGQRG